MLRAKIIFKFNHLELFVTPVTGVTPDFCRAPPPAPEASIPSAIPNEHVAKDVRGALQDSTVTGSETLRTLLTGEQPA